MKKRIIAFLLLAALFLLTGCQVRTVDQMYCLPRRPQSYNDLQAVIDAAMTDMGPNVAGVIGSAVAAGVFIALFG